MFRVRQKKISDRISCSEYNGGPTAAYCAELWQTHGEPPILPAAEVLSLAASCRSMPRVAELVCNQLQVAVKASGHLDILPCRISRLPLIDKKIFRTEDSEIQERPCFPPEVIFTATPQDSTMRPILALKTRWQRQPPWMHCGKQ